MKSINVLWLVGWIAASAAWAAEPGQVPGRILAGLRDSAAARRALVAHRATIRRELPRVSRSRHRGSQQSAATVLESLRRTGAFST